MTTVGAALTTIATIALADNTAYLIEAHFIGRRTDAADRAGYLRNVVAYREGGGGATLQGVVDTALTRESAAGYNATIVTSVNDILLQVAGIAGATVDWRVIYLVTQVA